MFTMLPKNYLPLLQQIAEDAISLKKISLVGTLHLTNTLLTCITFVFQLTI